jgi:hypothetical protein
MNDPADYCRQVETYLCRKNEGHLVRIVGPAFEQVRSWAERGVPLRIAFRGIDRYCERYYAKGPRRRPVRIEFCEDDVLDAFEDWRRAVGGAGFTAPETDGDAAQDGGRTTARKPSLPAHVERVQARLRHLLERDSFSPALNARLTQLLGRLDDVRDTAQGARGSAREAVIAHLGSLDAELMTAAAAELEPAVAERLRQEAAEEIRPFTGRMPADARVQALSAAETRLIRDTLALPVIAFE